MLGVAIVIARSRAQKKTGYAAVCKLLWKAVVVHF